MNDVEQDKILTERHPGSCESFPSELVACYQDAGLQSLNAHKIRTILFPLADLEMFSRKLVAFVFDVSVSIH